MATDPVCTMEVDESDPPAQTEYQGEMYYFCSIGCQNNFESNPDDYI